MARGLHLACEGRRPRRRPGRPKTQPPGGPRAWARPCASREHVACRVRPARPAGPAANATVPEGTSSASELPPPGGRASATASAPAGDSVGRFPPCGECRASAHPDGGSPTRRMSAAPSAMRPAARRKPTGARTFVLWPIRRFVALLAVAWITGACGAGPGAVGPLESTTTAPAPATAATTGIEPTPDAPSYPNLDRFADPLDRYAYRSGFGRCSIGDAGSLAGDYGGTADDPASIARAYARFANPTHEAAAEQGCLDGLRATSP